MATPTTDLQEKISNIYEMLVHIDRNGGMDDEYSVEVDFLNTHAEDFISGVGPYYRSKIRSLVVEAFFNDCLDMVDIAERFNITTQEANQIVRQNS